MTRAEQIAALEEIVADLTVSSDWAAPRIAGLAGRVLASLRQPDPANEGDPSEIYLQPKCCAEAGGRQWCEHDAFECDDNKPATRYIRTDLVEHAQATAEREACALALEAITGVREHEVFRGLRGTEGADGWRSLTPEERIILKSAARAIRSRSSSPVQPATGAGPAQEGK